MRATRSLVRGGPRCAFSYRTAGTSPVTGAARSVAWWSWWLKDDQDAKKMFVGDDCGLCNQAEDFEYGHNTLLR